MKVSDTQQIERIREASLHDAIMNLRANANSYEYKIGHRDARHAAAELALQRESALLARLEECERKLREYEINGAARKLFGVNRRGDMRWMAWEAQFVGRRMVPGTFIELSVHGTEEEADAAASGARASLSEQASKGTNHG